MGKNRGKNADGEISRKQLSEISDVPQGKADWNRKSPQQHWSCGPALGVQVSCTQLTVCSPQTWAFFLPHLWSGAWVQGTVLKVCMRLAAAKASPETSRNPTDTAPRQSCSYKINQIFAYRSFPTICSSKTWVRNVSSS